MLQVSHVQWSLARAYNEFDTDTKHTQVISRCAILFRVKLRVLTC